jgi:hypothetical protein
LLVGKPAKDGQLEEFAVEGLYEDDDQDDEDSEIHQLQDRHGQEDGGRNQVLN